MALSAEQLRIAARIDKRVRDLAHKGSSDLAIFMEMGDYMPQFKELMDAVGEESMDELVELYDGFYHYAKILEEIALGLESGDIGLPG